MTRIVIAALCLVLAACQGSHVDQAKTKKYCNTLPVQCVEPANQTKEGN